MPKRTIERTSLQRTRGSDRRSAVSASQSIVPWAPAARNCLSRSGAWGMASGWVMRQMSNPLAAASSFRKAVRVRRFLPWLSAFAASPGMIWSLKVEIRIM